MMRKLDKKEEVGFLNLMKRKIGKLLQSPV
jgi:hypothetical protein